MNQLPHSEEEGAKNALPKMAFLANTSADTFTDRHETERGWSGPKKAGVGSLTGMS